MFTPLSSSIPALLLLATPLLASCAGSFHVEIEDAGDPSHHVLAGDILSPGMTDQVAAAIVDFVLRR